MELKEQVKIFYKVNYLLFALTTLLLVSASISTLNSFRKYGYDYTYDIIINNVSNSYTHYVVSDVIVCIVFSLIVLVYMYNCAGWMEIKKILAMDEGIEIEVVKNEPKK